MDHSDASVAVGERSLMEVYRNHIEVDRVVVPRADVGHRRLLRDVETVWESLVCHNQFVIPHESKSSV